MKPKSKDLPFGVTIAGKFEGTAIEYRRVGLFRHGLQLGQGLLVLHPRLAHRAVPVEPHIHIDHLIARPLGLPFGAPIMT